MFCGRASIGVNSVTPVLGPQAARAPVRWGRTVFCLVTMEPLFPGLQVCTPSAGDGGDSSGQRSLSHTPVIEAPGCCPGEASIKGRQVRQESISDLEYFDLGFIQM